jgi:hypothetical protein
LLGHVRDIIRCLLTKRESVPISALLAPIAPSVKVSVKWGSAPSAAVLEGHESVEGLFVGLSRALSEIEQLATRDFSKEFLSPAELAALGLDEKQGRLDAALINIKHNFIHFSSLDITSEICSDTQIRLPNFPTRSCSASSSPSELDIQLIWHWTATAIF